LLTGTPSEVAEKMRVSASRPSTGEERSRFVWNFETFWQLDRALDHPEKNLDPLLDLIPVGRFGVGASYVNPHTALMTAGRWTRCSAGPVEWGRKPASCSIGRSSTTSPGHPIDLPHFMAKTRQVFVGGRINRLPASSEEVCHTPFGGGKGPTAAGF